MAPTSTSTIRFGMWDEHARVESNPEKTHRHRASVGQGGAGFSFLFPFELFRGQPVTSRSPVHRLQPRKRPRPHRSGHSAIPDVLRRYSYDTLHGWNLIRLLRSYSNEYALHCSGSFLECSVDLATGFLSHWLARSIKNLTNNDVTSEKPKFSVTITFSMQASIALQHRRSRELPYAQQTKLKLSGSAE